MLVQFVAIITGLSLAAPPTYAYVAPESAPATDQNPAAPTATTPQQGATTEPAPAQATPAGSEGAASATAEPTVEKRLQAWEEVETSESPQASPTPAPAASPTTGMPAAQQPAVDDSPSSEREDLQRRMRTGRGVAITGFVLDGLGLATLVLVSMPAAIAAEVAEDRASGDPWLASEQELQERADRRRRFANTSAIIGASVLAGGLVLTAVGLSIWLPARRKLRALRARDQRVSVTPTGLMVRF